MPRGFCEYGLTVYTQGMKINVGGIAVCVLGIFLVLSIFIYKTVSSNPEILTETPTPTYEKLLFSNTQVWDPKKIEFIYHIATTTREELLAHILLPPPPENESTTTRAELAQMHVWADARTPESIAAIKHEDQFNSEMVFGPLYFSDFFHATASPATDRLIQFIYAEYDPIIMDLKKQYDRVRPSYLDPSLTTVIPVPGHPAYPSGHASQIFMLAHILSELLPEARESFFEDAYEVAHNREIAGLHYPSDTEAGRVLAEQFFEIFRKRPYSEVLFEQARVEMELRVHARAEK